MVLIGVDGGNTKTDVLVVARDGEPVAFVRGGGSNSHGPGGAEGAIAVIAKLVAHTGCPPAEHGAFFLCGADVPGDVEAPRRALQPEVRTGDTDSVDTRHSTGASRVCSMRRPRRQ